VLIDPRRGSFSLPPFITRLRPFSRSVFSPSLPNKPMRAPYMCGWMDCLGGIVVFFCLCVSSLSYSAPPNTTDWGGWRWQTERSMFCVCKWGEGGENVGVEGLVPRVPSHAPSSRFMDSLPLLHPRLSTHAHQQRVLHELSCRVPHHGVVSQQHTHVQLMCEGG